MQIVIDIPEDSYERVMNPDKFYRDIDGEKIRWAVYKGTPLPKGHGRLVEITNQLEQELFTFTRYTGIDECPYESATLITDNAPTVLEADRGDTDANKERM